MRFLLFFLLFFTTLPVVADNVILMIGDGMGKNHISCTAKTHPLFLSRNKPVGEIQTYSANNTITDSAAGATAYACGIKTNNKFLGITPQKEACKTLAEESYERGYAPLIITTDVATGATPSAFYAHIDSRHKTKEIEQMLAKAQEKMVIKSVQYIDKETKEFLSTLSKSTTPFFMMIEESEIDKQSHNNNYQKMQEALIRFDKAVQTAVNFANNRKDTTVIVVADHETGGLTDSCQFTKDNHTGENVYYYVFGQRKNLFTEPVLQNTDIHHKIKEILFK